MSTDYKLILNWPREATNGSRSAVVVVVPPGPVPSGTMFQGANLSKAQADALASGGSIDLPTVWFVCDRYGRAAPSEPPV